MPMKTLLAAAAFLLAASILRAEDFTTLDGKKHSGTVSRTEPDGLVLMTDDGIEKLPFVQLSAEVQQKYGYDPERAERYTAATNAAAAQRQRQVDQIRAQQAAATEASTQSEPKHKEEKVVAKAATGLIVRPGKMTVDEIGESPFSLRGYAVEMTGWNSIDKQEAAAGVYSVTFNGDSKYIEAKMTAAQMDSVARSRKIYVRVKDQESYSTSVPVEVLGSDVMYEGLSNSPTFIWK